MEIIIAMMIGFCLIVGFSIFFLLYDSKWFKIYSETVSNFKLDILVDKQKDAETFFNNFHTKELAMKGFAIKYNDQIYYCSGSSYDQSYYDPPSGCSWTVQLHDIVMFNIDTKKEFRLKTGKWNYGLGGGVDYRYELQQEFPHYVKEAIVDYSKNKRKQMICELT